MKKQFRDWLSPPIFEGDEEKTWQAELLNTSSIVTLLIIVLVFVGNIVGGRTPPIVFIIEGGMFILFFLLRFLLYSGEISLVGGLFISSGTISLIAIIANLGSIRASATVGFFLVIVISGLLFSKRGVLLSTLFTSLAILGLIIAENAGVLPTPDCVAGLTHENLFYV